MVAMFSTHGQSSTMIAILSDDDHDDGDAMKRNQEPRRRWD